MNVQDLLTLINNTKWTFAKTFAKIAPHEYIMEWTNPVLFNEMKKLIDEKGFEKEFSLFGNSKMYKYYIFEGYKYWYIDNVLNRETVKDKA